MKNYWLNKRQVLIDWQYFLTYVFGITKEEAKEWMDGNARYRF